MGHKRNQLHLNLRECRSDGLAWTIETIIHVLSWKTSPGKGRHQEGKFFSLSYRRRTGQGAFGMMCGDFHPEFNRGRHAIGKDRTCLERARERGAAENNPNQLAEYCWGPRVPFKEMDITNSFIFSEAV